MKALLPLFAAGLLVGCGSPPDAAPGDQHHDATIPITSTSPEAVAHFHKGELLLSNLRRDEAAAEFSEALKLDPAFALAHAYHGAAMPGADGLAEIESAEQAAANLPEAERELIKALAANGRGDQADVIRSLSRVTELAPGDYRGFYLLGQRQFVDQQYGDAAKNLKKAIELNPSDGGALNMLGYAALRQGDSDAAVAAFTDYTRLLPQEPNPQDSLGEALLGAGRFEASEAAFQKALELSPQFWNAHQGMAYARFYAGDWTGGRQALEKAKAAASAPSDRIGLDQELAAAAAAERKTADALRILDAAEKTGGAQPADVAFIPVRRAWTLVDAGRARDALKPLAAALTMADGGQLPPGLARNLRREALRARITAEAQLGDAAAAQKTSQSLDESAAAHATDAAAQSAMHYGRGELAMAKRDLAAARTHFEQCSSEDARCKWQEVAAAEKAGDQAGAAAVRTRLLEIYTRDPEHLIVRSRLTPGRTT